MLIPVYILEDVSYWVGFWDGVWTVLIPGMSCGIY